MADPPQPCGHDLHLIKTIGKKARSYPWIARGCYGPGAWFLAETIQGLTPLVGARG